MKNTKNTFSAFVGLDWADQKHDVSVCAVGETPVHQVVTHTPEALHEWLINLHKQYPDGPIALCLEQTRGAVIYHLLGYEFLTLFPVNPKSLARFRETFTGSRAKNDISDADYLRELVMLHHDRFRSWVPDDVLTRTMMFLAENRRKIVNDRTRLTNRLLSLLKMYFPQAVTLSGGVLHRQMALDFLDKWPVLVAVQRAKQKTVEKFYTSHNSRSSGCIKERLELIHTSTPLTTDQAVIKSSQMMVKTLTRQIYALNKAIEEFDVELKTLYDDHPDKDIFSSFPGSGNNLGPRLVSAWGSDRSRYDSASSMQEYSGTAPVTRSSGKSKNVVRRFACPKFILQTFHEYANVSRSRSIWAQAYYEKQRNHGKSHHVAIRALAFKWIRIMFRCWQNRVKYDEVKYIQALKKSNSPLLEFI